MPKKQATSKPKPTARQQAGGCRRPSFCSDGELHPGELNALARYHEVQGKIFTDRKADNYGWHNLPDGGDELRKSAAIQVRYHIERREHWLRVLKEKHPQADVWADGPMRSCYGV